jgi:hypothetical protein
VVCGLIGLFFGLYLLRNPKPGWQTLSVTPMKMILIGCLNLALSPLLALIHFINGPPRNVELEASSMMLKADRSIAGDRVISDYDIEEVLCLFNENNVLCIETRKGNSQLIAFGRQQINEAIAFLIAQHFWYPLEITVAKVSSGIGRRTVFMPRIDPPATSAHAAIVRALGLNQ